MTARHLLKQLRELGADLQLHGSDIQVDAPRGTIDDAILSRIRRHKSALRLLLDLEVRRPVGTLIPDTVSALELKHALGWDVLQFTRFCHPLIGRPGPSCVEEDLRVLDAMLASVQEGCE